MNWQRLSALAFCLLFWAAVLLFLAGCEQRPGPTQPPSDAVPPGRGAPGSKATPYPMGDDLPVIVDAETGCQYIGYTGHGVTPRMSRYEDGKQRQLGCFEVIHMKNPMEGLNK